MADSYKGEAWYEAAKNGNLDEIINYFSGDYKLKHLNEAFIRAGIYGHLHIIKYLHELDVNDPNPEYLIDYYTYDDVAFDIAVANDYIEIFDYLLDSIDFEEFNDVFCLEWAIYNEAFAMADHLINEYNVDIADVRLGYAVMGLAEYGTYDGILYYKGAVDRMEHEIDGEKVKEMLNSLKGYLDMFDNADKYEVMEKEVSAIFE